MSSRLLLPVIAALALGACSDGADDPPGDARPPMDMAVGPDPDATEQAFDAAEPEPDAAEPEPDAAEPEPDAGCLPVAELCNGEDEDCDGNIDEGFDVGAACAVAVGACAADGLTVCAADGASVTCDATPGEPGDEVCNGEDDDCDGQTDEALGGGACDTGRPGACGAGTLACADGESVCTPAVEPTDELCDGVDNDCDGEVDDVPGAGAACTAGTGACARDGVTACGAGGLACDAVPGEPGLEVCNGVDDDCNGVVDDAPGLGQPCSVGLGVCRVEGRTACGPDGELCDAAPLPAGDELCNGLDDDCDGRADELPECADEICDNGQDDDGDGNADCADADCADFPACRPFELCGNGLDDDGDGGVDCEDVDCALDPLCAAPLEDCDNGVDDDGDGAVDCDDAECQGAPACRPPLEICDNGQDDNGDGRVDCDDPECAGLPGCLPDPEICDNGQDDDGDGLVDCDDPACAAELGCVPDEICDNGEDDDGDAQVDCLDVDCAADPGCAPPPDEDCGNRLDDDGDGLIDCDDPDCQFAVECIVPLEICDNGVDDDGDGGVDCADIDCAFFEGCLPDEICDNGVDDDRDGAADCDDAQCAAHPACVVDEATPIAQPGGAIVLEGRLDADSPTFARPDEQCGFPVDGVRYEAFRIVNRTGAPQVLDVEALWGVGDGFLLIYAAPFDPAAPLDGCIVGNDDDLVIARSAVRDQPIGVDEELVVVATTFDPGEDLGPYAITVSTRRPGDPEICDNGADEDGDGRVDCADADCADAPICARIPIAPPGGSIALDGVLDADSPTYDREADGCRPVNQPGRRFQAFEIVNGTGADRLVTVTARWNVGDGYLFVYRSPFDPANAAVNCIDGDDDFSDFADSQVAQVPIADGEVLVIVATSFDPNEDVGPFQISVQTLAGGPAVEICDNLRDDDGDGLADCDDPACGAFPACARENEDCLNGLDDDGDGAIDCADLDCADVVQCIDEVCDNGEDDDGDGAVDCGDADCGGFPGCDACPAIDFEGGVIPGFFGESGDAPWEVVDGAATSGVIDDFESSGLVLDVVVGDGGRVQFDYRVSSEAIFDFLRFFVDGVEVETWDGEQGFETVGFDLAPGEHTLEWRYTKDSSQFGGDDLAQIDNVVVLGAVFCPGDPLAVRPVPIALPGGAVTLEGELDGGSPRFSRPAEDCVGANADRRFQVFAITNRTGADQRVDVLATWNVGDGLLLVYDAFDPADGEAGCVAGDDDIVQDDTSASHIADLPIAAGETLFVVATSFAANSDIGPFSIAVSTVLGEQATCAAPLPVGAGVYGGSTEAMASALAGACGGDGSPEAVHRLAGDGGVYCVDTEGSEIDTVLYVFEGDCAGAELSCNDDTVGLANFASRVEVATAAGVDYLVVVDGYADEFGFTSGGYVLNIAEGLCP